MSEMSKTTKFRISAKKLGDLLMPDFCKRCFWIRHHLGCEPPFSVFPRIFGDIDGYTKRIVHGQLDESGMAPSWLSGLGNIAGYIEPPKSSKFQMPIGDDILLTGEADAIFKLANARLIIADYKTAYCRGKDDPLFPIYLMQLNCYALIAEHLGMGKVERLALIYAEPQTSHLFAREKCNNREDGFALGFAVKLLEVELNTSIVPKIAQKAYELFSLIAAPEGRDGCQNCEKMDSLIDTVTSTTFDFSQMR